MSAVVIAENYFSVENYLALEDKAEFKSEYYNGAIFSMAGGTLNHNRIAGNVHFSLKLALKNKPFDIFIADVKLHIPSTNSFTYPDVFVIKGKPAYWQNRRDIISRATLVIEILSARTQHYDRTEKFANYRSLPELHDYILISQDQVHLQHFEKQSSQQWLLNEYSHLEDNLVISQFDQSISLEDIYQKIVFEH